MNRTKGFRVYKNEDHTKELEVLEEIKEWIHNLLGNLYYDKKKKHYVSEIQKTVDIKVKINYPKN